MTLIIGLIGCSPDSTTPNTTPASEGEGARLTIEGRAFGSAPDLAPSETLTIVNLDSVRHTFSSDDGSWERVEIAGNSEASFVAPDDAGTYRFFCEVHPDMGGSITIGS